MIAQVRLPPAPVVPAVLPPAPVVPPRPPVPVVPAVLPPVPPEPVVPAVLPPVLPPAPVVPPMPLVTLQLPFVQVPLQARLQPPQWALLVFVSTQVAPHSISGAVQTQVLLLHVAPDGQALPHDPQFAASLASLAHLPAEHFVSSDMQSEAHCPLLHTCVPVQVFPQLPQLLMSEATHPLAQLI